MYTTTAKDRFPSDLYGGGAPFRVLDRFRRWQGETFSSMGAGPIVTPGRILLRKPGISLKGYARGNTPALLLVPAPVKSSCIWDLSPRNSVVRRCLSHGLQVYLIQWEHPGKCARQLGLAEYADEFILDCLDAIGAETGLNRVFLAGHSLGGTFSAVFAALHPERLHGLVLLGAPLNFETDADAFGSLVANAPDARVLTTVLGSVPGSFINLVCSVASPATFITACWLDWFNSLYRADTLRTHIRVRRWMLDENPVADRLFEEVVELLYRENRFMRRCLLVGNRLADPGRIDLPVLSVVQPGCRIAPPRSILPFHEAINSNDKRVLCYQGDTGVALQHIGMLVGNTAHRILWPEILKWIIAHDRL